MNCLGGFGLLAPATISEGAVSDEPNLKPEPTKADGPELALGLEDGSTASAPDSLAFFIISCTKSAPVFFFDGPNIQSREKKFLDEIKSYLESNSEDHETHLIMVSKTKLETLENIYSQKRNELDTIQENA